MYVSLTSNTSRNVARCTCKVKVNYRYARLRETDGIHLFRVGPRVLIIVREHQIIRGAPALSRLAAITAVHGQLQPCGGILPVLRGLDGCVHESAQARTQHDRSFL